MGSKVGTPGVRTLASSPVSVTGWLGHEHHGPQYGLLPQCHAVLGTFDTLSPPTLAHALCSRHDYCPVFLDLGGTIKRGHTPGSRSQRKEEGGTKSEMQVCALDRSAISCPLGAPGSSTIKWSACLRGWLEEHGGPKGQGSVSVWLRLPSLAILGSPSLCRTNPGVLGFGVGGGK